MPSATRITHKIAQSFEVDDALLQEFRKFLDEEKIPYTEAEMIENNDWLRSNIKSELFVDAFGQEEGLKVRAETDPDVIKALELMPQARALADNAKKVIAERNSAAPVTALASRCRFQLRPGQPGLFMCLRCDAVLSSQRHSMHDWFY